MLEVCLVRVWGLPCHGEIRDCGARCLHPRENRVPSGVYTKFKRRYIFRNFRGASRGGPLQIGEFEELRNK